MVLKTNENLSNENCIDIQPPGYCITLIKNENEIEAVFLYVT